MTHEQTEESRGHAERNLVLWRAYREGDQKSLDLLVKENTPYIYHCLKSFGVTESERQDAFQEGVLGLMTAVGRYNPEGGATLMGYARFWIKQNVIRGVLEKRHTVRKPSQVYWQNQKIEKFIREYQEIHGTEPTPADIAEAFGMSEHRIGEIRSVSGKERSFDAPLLQDDSSSDNGYELFGDAREPRADQLAIARDEFRLAVQACIELRDFIDGRYTGERSHFGPIFYNRYGLFGYGPAKTLEDTAALFGITRERVRQIASLIFEKAHARKQKINSEDVLVSAIRCIYQGIDYFSHDEPELVQQAHNILAESDILNEEINRTRDTLLQQNIATPLSRARLFTADDEYILNSLRTCVTNHVNGDDPEALFTTCCNDFGFDNPSATVSPEALQRIRDNYSLSIVNNDIRRLWKRGYLFAREQTEGKALLTHWKQELDSFAHKIAAIELPSSIRPIISDIFSNDPQTDTDSLLLVLGASLTFDEQQIARFLSGIISRCSSQDLQLKSLEDFTNLRDQYALLHALLT